MKNEMTKLELYKRISGVWTDEDYEDMLDELTDRFGEPTYEVMNLLMIAKLRAKAHAAFIAGITYKNKQVHIEMAPGVQVKVELLDDFLTKYLNNIRVVISANPGFVIDMEKRSLKNFMADLEEIVADIHELIER